MKAFKYDVGMMGGTMAHEFMYLTPIGEDSLLVCDNCGYAANRQIARFTKDPAAPEKPEKLQKVATPGTKTIEELAEFLNTPKSWVYSRSRETGAGSMPRIKVGKYVRFELDKVMHWLKQQNEAE